MKLSLVALLFLGVLTPVEASHHHQSIAEAEDLEDDMLLETEGPACEYLDETAEELNYQQDMFSRTLDPRHWTNVVNIATAMQKKTGVAPKLAVTTWELMDKAFSFPRVRRYNFVNENMDMLEHFQDNLNTNISNTVNMANFMRVAKTVKDNFKAKYHDGEFDDPGTHDPREEAETPKTWSQL
jgi:hypothetical protein